METPLNRVYQNLWKLQIPRQKTPKSLRRARVAFLRNFFHLDASDHSEVLLNSKMMSDYVVVDDFSHSLRRLV